MNINLVVTKEELFKKWLLYLNPILKLTDTERDILTMFLHLVCINAKADKRKVSNKVFSSKVRKAMRLRIGISEPCFNNYYSALKKKGFIVKKDYGLDVVEKIKIDITKDNYLRINFKLK